MEDSIKLSSSIYKSTRVGLRILFLGGLVIGCFNTLRPFMVTIAWGVVIAVGVYPLHLKFAKRIGGRKELAAIFMTVLGILLIVIPAIIFTNVTVENIYRIAEVLERENIDIDISYEKMMVIPVIGEYLSKWLDFTTNNIEEVFDRFKPQIKSIAPKILSLIARIGVTFLQFLISIIIAGGFLAKAEGFKEGTERFFSILIGDYVENFPLLAAASIRSVVQGVIGVGILQGGVSAIGMFIMGVPGTGILSFLVMVLSIIQLPVYFVLFPVAGYVFITASTTPAIIYIIWTLFVGILDNILKPVILGRGVDVPSLVILLGAVGGLISQGIIGLFMGPVILVLGYKILGVLLEKNYTKGV